jgi:SAM-dependent methyltransferase
VNGLAVLVCKCGVKRQDVPMDLAGYADWYRREYHATVYYHSYAQDRKVAALRLEEYTLPAASRVLDIGCGNNAFVDEALERGIDAWGQELAEQAESPRTYVGTLHDVAFPTESFDAVTIHDVLEHVPDMKAMLAEVRRVLKPGGTMFLDFPRFAHPAGRHHWKPVEHIWLLDEGQLRLLLRECGFTPVRTWNPVESKVVIAAKARPQSRLKVLVPPGIGDSYWSFTKLGALLRHEGFEGAEVYVQHSGGPYRTHPYVQNVALAKAAGYMQLDANEPLFHEAYHLNGRTLFPKVLGVDYFVAYNGILRWGRGLEEVDRHLDTDWWPRTHFSKEAEKARDETAGGEPYVVAYFVGHGMYRNWLREFPLHLADQTLALLEQHGLKTVVVGASWDRNSPGDLLGRRRGRTNLVGQTSFDQLYGILAGAQAVFGFPSGATLLAPTLGTPTVLLWNKFFDRRFWVNSVAPGSPYLALDTAGLRPNVAADAVIKNFAVIP